MARISWLLVVGLVCTGPYAVAGVDRWTPTGPPGAFVVTLLLDPEDPDILYAATFSIGSYKSTDRGETWQPLVSASFADFRVLAIDPSNPSVLYATTPTELIRSADGGSTWAPLSTDLPRPPVFLLVAPSDPSALYAGTFGDGVFRSADGGQSWSPIDSGLPELDTQTLAVDPTDASTVYFGVTSLFKSINGGANWTSSSNGLPSAFPRGLTIDPLDPTTLYMLPGDLGVYKSTDGGQSWNPSNNGLTDLLILRLAMDPSNPQILYATSSTELFRTIDGGATWTSLGALSIDSFGSAIFYDPRPPATLFLTSNANGSGIYKSTDEGATWDLANGGINGRFLTSVAVAPSDPQVLYVGLTTFDLGTGVSHDGGRTWEIFGERVLPGQGARRSFRSLAVDPSDLDIVYGGDFDDGMFKTVDGARTWTEINQGITDLEIRSIAVEPPPGGTVLVGTQGGKIFRSLDGGLNWADYSMGLGGGVVHEILFDSLDSSKLWAATFQGLYVSEGGASWSLVLSGAFTAVKLAEPDPTRFYAARTNNLVYRSSNGGATWTSFPVPGSFAPVDLVVDPAEPDRLLVVSPFEGIFLSEDGGETWERRNEGLFSLFQFLQLAVSATQPTTFFTVKDLSTLFALNLAQPPLLTATKTVSGELFDGGTVVYLLTLTNLGDDEQPDNPGDEMVDVLPAEMTDPEVQVLEGGGVAVFDSNTHTVTWNGSIPGHASVVIRIEGTLEGAPIGSVVTNQAQVFFDSDSDGANDAATLSSDPESGGATGFVVRAVIPTLDPLGALFLMLLLTLAAFRVFCAARS